MNELLQLGQVLYTSLSNFPCQVEQFLGGGGQGEVYQATLLNQPVALKWYFPHYLRSDSRLKERLNEAIKIGAPNDRFLWPMELVTSKNGQGLGYVMPLRDSHYRGFVELLKREIELSFRALTTAGFELADSFNELHARGLYYCDISFGNVFLQPETGHILICDNDNVDINKANQSLVLGTQDFMAPEVVRRQSQPCRETDLFSLAVLLFYMFIAHHPLQGKLEAEIKCLDLPARIKLYGTNPIFIFDPEDCSNRPIPGLHQNAIDCWQIYPQFLRNLFTKAFTRGIHNPNQRIQETEWKEAMAQLRDSIIYCPHCQVENFYDISQSAEHQTQPCWNPECQQEIQIPSRIHINRAYIMLNHDTQLFPHHVDSQQQYNFSEPIAAVTRHPSNSRIWGLKNLSNQKWMITSANGHIQEVGFGRSVTLVSGTKIDFGKAEGVIH